MMTVMNISDKVLNDKHPCIKILLPYCKLMDKFSSNSKLEIASRASISSSYNLDKSNIISLANRRF